MKARFSAIALFPLLVLSGGLLVVAMQYLVSTVFDARLIREESERHFVAIHEEIERSGRLVRGRDLAQNSSDEIVLLTGSSHDLRLAVVLDDTDVIVESSDPQLIGQPLDVLPELHDIAGKIDRKDVLEGHLEDMNSGHLLIGVRAIEFPDRARTGNDSNLGLIGIILDQQRLIQVMKNKRLSVMACSVLLLCLVTGVLWLFPSRILIRPLQRISSTIRSFTRGNHSASDHLTRTSEVGEISMLLDTLAAMNKEKDYTEESRNRLAQIVEESVTEIFVAHADSYKILNANRAARENLGYSLEECQQLMPWDFVESLSEEDVEGLVSSLKSGEVDSIDFQTRQKRKDGTTYPVSACLQIMPNLRPPIVTAMVQDLTTSRLQEQNVRLRDRAMEELDVGVAIVDVTRSELPMVYVNRRLCELSGYSAEQLIGCGPEILRDEKINDEEVMRIRSAISRGDPLQTLLTYTRKGGAYFKGDLSLSPVHDVEGELTHYVAIIRDMTKKLEMEASFNRTRKIEAIGQLAGGVAHDFNNLLSVIIGNIEFVQQEAANEHHRELLSQADAAAQMGARLTRKLLSFAKQDQLEQVVLDVNGQIREALALLRTTIGQKYVLESSLAPDLWNILADPTGIENAVVNLALNARDAMPDGGQILIRTHNLSIGVDDLDDFIGFTSGDYIQLSVSDKGVGMSPEVIERVFEPFFTTKDLSENSGLGLASTYGFAKQSGGGVLVDSKAGSGAVISILLPRNDAPIVAAQAINQATPSQVATHHRVLVVEDDAMVRDVTVERLLAFGYVTTHVRNGVEAIELLEKNADFDLVLTDLVMGGGVSGYDVADWVHSHLPLCKVLLTSGYSDERVEEGNHFGNRPPLLQKPYRMAELKQAISTILVGA